MTNQFHIRRGISLLEVLISMFVLLFGLMGVAAVFPVGNHYAGKGEQFDRGSALAEAAMADLKARGMLKPELWLYADNPPGNEAAPLTTTVAGLTYKYPVRNPSVIQYSGSPYPGNFNVATAANSHPGYAFVIDPMGAAPGLAPGSLTGDGVENFPYINLATSNSLESVNRDMPAGWNATASAPGLIGNLWPIRRLTLSIPDPAATAGAVSIVPMTTPVGEVMFRLHDDVTNELPKQDDRPGIQRWSANTNGYSKDEPWRHTLLSRQYAGSYSWLATIVPTSIDSLAALQPTNTRFGSDLYEVSVAVLHRRESIAPSVATERTISAQFRQGNELVLYDNEPLAVDLLDAAAEGVRPGNWIAVAGVHPTTGVFLMRWYRVLSIDEQTLENDPYFSLGSGYSTRRLMLDGPDWPLSSSSGGVANNLRAILLPGVISVATQMLPMEAQ